MQLGEEIPMAMVLCVKLLLTWYAIWDVIQTREHDTNTYNNAINYLVENTNSLFNSAHQMMQITTQKHAGRSGRK